MTVPTKPRDATFDPFNAPMQLAAVALALGGLLVLSGTAHAADDEPREVRELSPEAKPEARPVEMAAHTFRWPGEELYYSVRLNDAEAMRASVRAGDVRRLNGQPYVPISGSARSVGFFDQIYPLDDQGHTFLSPGDHRPLRSEKHFEERGNTRTYKVDYTHSDFRAKVEKEKNDRKSKFNYAIPGTTHDMISWMYDLRSRPDLSVGDEFSFYVYDGWKLSRVDLEVVGKEDVLTPKGWFKGWKLTFVRQVLDSKRETTGDNSFKDPELEVRAANDKSGYLWLSRDENRLPIKVSIDTKFGKGEALLIEYTPHKKRKRPQQSPERPNETVSDSPSRPQTR